MFYVNGWTDDHGHFWKLAQLAFPLLLAVTLGLASHQNYLGLIIFVMGCWKFGSPETIMSMYSALHCRHFSKIHILKYFLNGVGTIVHHTACATLMCMLTSGTVRSEQSIVGTWLILLMQHWFVLVKYINNTAYCVLEILLEVWFEWEVISNLEKYHAIHWTVELIACNMLAAHWIFS